MCSGGPNLHTAADAEDRKLNESSAFVHLEPGVSLRENVAGN